MLRTAILQSKYRESVASYASRPRLIYVAKVLPQSVCLQGSSLISNLSHILELDAEINMAFTCLIDCVRIAAIDKLGMR